MIKEVYKNQDFHKNGAISYEETIAIVEPMFLNLYPNHRIHPNGYYWIRIGINAKYHDNGQMAWVIKYDDFGNPMKRKMGEKFSWRKDGTVIE